MKMISWNVNGLRACTKKGLYDFIARENADIYCFQETKMQENQKEIDLENYYEYWYSAEKKGYSGTAIFTKQKPLNITYGIGKSEHDNEGRLINAEFENFHLITIYTPNSQRELARLEYRMQWEDELKLYLKTLKKPQIICGDLNVAHQEIDLKNPKTNTKNAGFTIEERTKFTELLNCGYKDAFRFLYPDEIKYTWWSYMHNARENNIGWRIDYFVVSDSLQNNLKDFYTFTDVFGSDHCPVGISIDL